MMGNPSAYVSVIRLRESVAQSHVPAINYVNTKPISVNISKDSIQMRKNERKECGIQTNTPKLVLFRSIVYEN